MSTLRQQLLEDKAEIERKLAIINRVPEDTFTFGTVIVLSPSKGQRTYWVKIGEELWRNLKNNSETDLAHIIFLFEESHIGYFEVYVLKPQEVPIYASE